MVSHFYCMFMDVINGCNRLTLENADLHATDDLQIINRDQSPDKLRLLRHENLHLKLQCYVFQSILSRLSQFKFGVPNYM